MRRELIFIGLLLAACGSDRLVAGPGAGGETTNGVFARVLRPDGTPASGSVVILRTTSGVFGSDTDGSRGDSAVTDSDGLAKINVSSGTLWTAEARSADGKLLATDSIKDNAVSLRLGATASIQGRVAIESSSPPVRVALPGLGRSAICDSLGRWRMDSLPQGLVRIAARNTVGNQPRTDFLRRVLVAGHQPTPASLDLAPTTPDDPSLWTDSVSIGMRLDSLRMDTLLERQFLLVRFDSSNLDFSKTDGTDLRFFRDHRRLGHALERWDATRKQAWVRVLVDSVDARSDSLLSLSLRYGNPRARDLADPSLPSEWIRFPGGGTHLGGPSGIFDTLDGSPAISSDIPAVSGAFTTSLWLRPSATALDKSCLICGLDASGDKIWGLVAVASDTSKIRFFVGADTTEASYSMVRDVWVRISASWDPATGHGTLRMNGFLEKEFQSLPGTAVTRSLRIGEPGWRGSLAGIRVVAKDPSAASDFFQARTEAIDGYPVRIRKLE